MILEDFIGIGVCLLLLAALVAYLLIKVRLSYVFKFILIPMTLCVALLAIALSNDVLGVAKPGLPKDQFRLLYFAPHVTKSGDVMIDFLVNEGARNRFYTYPYSRELEEKFNQLMTDDGRLRLGRFNGTSIEAMGIQQIEPKVFQKDQQ